MSENICNYMAVKDVAKLLGKGQATIKRWCERKKLKAKKDGKEWRIERDSVYRLIPRPPVEIENKKPAGIDTPEADRLIKLEKLRKEKRINDIEEHELVDVGQYKSNLEEIFSCTWEFFREFLDKWMVRINLNTQQKKEIGDDFEGELFQFLQKEKNKAMRMQ